MTENQRIALLKRNFKHGLAKTREHHAWLHAKARCFNPRCAKFRYYGGRGITMCEEWKHSFMAFLTYIGPCPKGYWLDRIDTNKGYEPGNVRWVSAVVQQNNKRNNVRYLLHGRLLTIPQWAREFGMDENIVRQRVHRGWDIARALMTPPQHKFCGPEFIGKCAA